MSEIYLKAKRGMLLKAIIIEYVAYLKKIIIPVC